MSRAFADMLDRILLFYYINEVATQIYTVGSFGAYWKSYYNKLDFGVVCANVVLEAWYVVVAPDENDGPLAIVTLALRVAFRVVRLVVFLSRVKQIAENPQAAVSVKLGGSGMIRRMANSNNLAALRRASKEKDAPAV